MAVFRYTAYDSQGNRASGRIEAPSEQSALDMLARSQLHATAIEQEADEAPAPAWWDRQLFSNQLGGEQLAVFMRELATLAAASLPIDEALRIIAVQPLLPSRARALATAIESRIAAGLSLSEALAAQNDTFAEFSWRLVRAGETSGRLVETLEALATHAERSAEITSRIFGALLYPAVVMAAASVSLAVIVAVLVPAIAPLFADAGVPPPPLIAVLASLQKWLAYGWPIVLTAGVLVAALVYAGLRSTAVQRARHRILLSLPLVGHLVRQREISRLASTLSMLVGNGVPLLDALDVAGRVLRNMMFREAVATAHQEVTGGAALSESLARSGLMSEVALRLITVGERSGSLAVMLARVADVHNHALQRSIDRLSSLVAPLSTVLIGTVVGGLVLSVLSAVVSVNELAFR